MSDDGDAVLVTLAVAGSGVDDRRGVPDDDCEAVTESEAEIEVDGVAATDADAAPVTVTVCDVVKDVVSETLVVVVDDDETVDDWEGERETVPVVEPLPLEDAQAEFDAVARPLGDDDADDEVEEDARLEPVVITLAVGLVLFEGVHEAHTEPLADVEDVGDKEFDALRVKDDEELVVSDGGTDRDGVFDGETVREPGCEGDADPVLLVV